MKPENAVRKNYWQELLKKFGLRLDQFGHRGDAAFGNHSKVYIRPDKNELYADAAVWWLFR